MGQGERGGVRMQGMLDAHMVGIADSDRLVI